MSRLSLIIAACLTFFSLGTVPEPAHAVPLQHFSDDTSRMDLMVWEPDLKSAANGNPFPAYSLTAPLNTAQRHHGRSDPCGFSQGWLAQHKNGVVICGTLADFYAPKVTPYPATRSADISGGSGLALLFLGLVALGLATRRPVWITHFMR